MEVARAEQEEPAGWETGLSPFLVDSSEPLGTSAGSGLQTDGIALSAENTTAEKMNTYKTFPIIRLIRALPVSLESTHDIHQRAMARWSATTDDTLHLAFSATHKGSPADALQRFYEPYVSHHIATRPPDYLRKGLQALLQTTRASMAARSSTESVLLELLLEKMLPSTPLHNPGRAESTTEEAAYPPESARHDTDASPALKGILKNAEELPLPDVMADEEMDDTMTTAEKLLYVILRTSVMGNTNRGWRGTAPSSDSSLSSAETLVVKKGRGESTVEGDVQTLWAKHKKTPYTRDHAAWQSSGGVPRCWLTGPTVALIESSKKLRRELRWSSEQDPVVHATLIPEPVAVSQQQLYLLAANARRLLPRCAVEPISWGDRTAHSLCLPVDEAEVQRLFQGSSRNSSSHPVTPAQTNRAVEPSLPPPSVFTASEPLPPIQHKDPLNAQRENVSHPFAYRAESPHDPVAASPLPLFVMFKPECSCEVLAAVYLALHRCVVGMEDPYMLVVRHRTESGELPPSHSSVPSSPSKSRLKRLGLSNPVVVEPSVKVNDRFFTERDRGKRELRGAKDGSQRATKRLKHETHLQQEKKVAHRLTFSRGLLSMLEWGCECGTMLLRLERLCQLADLPERKPALGSYGQCAMSALRQVIQLTRRQAFDVSQRHGGWRQLTFGELVEAKQRLERLRENVFALAHLFHVSLADDWDASMVLQHSSSATLLSKLFQCYAVRHESTLGGGDNSMVEFEAEEMTIRTPYDEISEGFDAVAHLLRAVFHPLQRMLTAWLTKGTLDDPLDEFFIVPSHTDTESGFRVDASPHRLPTFISQDAAHLLLHAGLSLRALCHAASEVVALTTSCSDHCQRVTGDAAAPCGASNYTADDAAAIRWLLECFMDSLLGRSPADGPCEPLLPTTDFLLPQSSLPYWSEHYTRCNQTLLRSNARNREGGVSPDALGLGGSFGFLPVRQSNVLLSSKNLEPHRCGTPSSHTQSYPSNASHLTIYMDSDEEMDMESYHWQSSDELTSRGTPSSASSLSSKVSMTLFGAISQELRHVSRHESYAAISEQSNQVLRDKFLRSTRERQRRLRLQQWRDERRTLQSLRQISLATEVEELRDMYESLSAARSRAGNMEVDTEVNPWLGCLVEPLPEGLPAPQPPPVQLYPLEAMERGAEPPSRARVRFEDPVLGSSLASSLGEGGVITELEKKEKASSQSPTATKSALALGPEEEEAVAPESLLSSLVDARPAAETSENERKGAETPLFFDEVGFPHYASHYHVGDINDDEYFTQRNGPRVAVFVSASVAANDARVTAAVEKYMKEQESIDISSPAYLKHCEKMAEKFLMHQEDQASEEAPLPATVSDSEVESFFTPKQAFTLSQPWLDEMSFFFRKHHKRPAGELSPVEANEALVGNSNFAQFLTTLRMSKTQKTALQACPAYYLRLGMYTCRYLTHKALQVLLLPPYGPLYRILIQILDVCLMQSPSAAAHLMDWWLPYSQEMLEQGFSETPFNTADMVVHLNRVFREEWDKCAPGAGKTMWLEIVLEDKGGDGIRASQPKGPPLPRKLSTQELRYENLRDPSDMEDGEPDHKAYQNPVDFLNDLSVRVAGSSSLLGVLPENALEDAGDLFCSLLLWKTMEQLVTQTWKAGMESDVPDVFFFCNVARQVFLGIQQHFWDALCHTAAAYRETLGLQSTALYAHHHLEDFTTEMQQFLQTCRFAALLTRHFLISRRLLYGLLRVVEEIYHVVTRSNQLVAEARQRIRSRMTAGEAAPMERCSAVATKLQSTCRTSTLATPSSHVSGKPNMSGKIRKTSVTPTGHGEETWRAELRDGMAELAAEQRQRRATIQSAVRKRLRTFAVLLSELTQQLEEVVDEQAPLLMIAGAWTSVASACGDSHGEHFERLQLLLQKLRVLEEAVETQLSTLEDRDEDTFK